MSHIRLSASREIAADAAHVWGVLADYHRDPQWRAGVVAMTASTDGLARPGTTTREELRLAGRTWINDAVIEAVDPGRHLRWRTVHGADADGDRRVDPLEPDRCRVTLELRVRPHGFERLIVPVVRRMLARNLGGDLERLESIVLAEIADRTSVR